MLTRQIRRFERLETRRLLAVTVDNLPATDISFDSATIGVDVQDFDAFTPTISLFWGQADGGTDFNNWENREQMGERELGQHEVTLTDLSINTTYYYRVSAFSFDGVGWAPQTSSFSTLAPQPPSLTAAPIIFAGGTNARVAGRIESTGGDIPTVRVYYGPEDGGNQPDQWESTVTIGTVSGDFEADVESLLPGQSYFYRFAATNSGGTNWSETESFNTATVPPLVISELSAAGTTVEGTDSDEEPFGTRIRSDRANTFAGDAIVYDWLELANNTAQPVDISRYSLTDDSTETSKWSFPDGATIAPLSSIVVFASGLDISDPQLDENNSYHTNFRLSASQGYLGLFDSSGSLVHEANDSYPNQITNVTYGYFGDSFSFMEESTPGRPNVPGKLAVATTPRLSLASHSFTDAFEVEISAGDGEQVRYTLDGTVPTESSNLYEAPIQVADSVQIRARSFRDNHVPSEIAGEGYLKINEEAADFRSHLPIVVVDNFDGRRPSSRQVDAFMAIFDVSDDTGQSSLLTSPHVASRIGIKVRGQSSAGDTKTPYRVETRDQHGRDLDIAPLGLPADADWVLHGPWSDRTLVHNSISYELANEIGLVAPRTRFVELFRNLNGGGITDNDYLGLYLLVESIKRSPDRVDIPDLDPGQVQSESISGGYILRFEQEVSESRDRLNGWRHLELFDGQKYSPEQKSWITDYVNQTDAAIDQADSSREYEQFIDVDSFVNNLVMHELGRDQDAYVRSHYYHKDRGGKLVAGPLWDFNLIWNRGCCFDNRNPRGWQFDQDRPGRDTGWNKGDHNWNGKLMKSWDFSQRFIDRWNHLRQDNNLLSLDSLMARVDRHVTDIGDAATRNFTRFRTLLTNGAGFGGPRFPTYEEHINDMKEWIATRLEWIDDQFRTPPQIEELNGAFRMSGDEGTIYYTLDGTDPFDSMTGEPSVNAIAYDGSEIDVADDTRIIARLYDASVAPRRTELTKTQWSAPSSTIISTAVPASSQNLRITELHYHPYDAMAQFGEPEVDDDEFEFVEIKNVSETPIDLSGVRFVETGIGDATEGIAFDFAPQILQPDELRIIVANRDAFSSRHPSVDSFAVGNGGVDDADGQYRGRLSNSGESITVLDAEGELIQAFTYADSGPWAVRADGSGSSLEIVDVNADLNDPANWRASQSFEGSPGVDAPSDVRDVVVNELLTNSAAPSVDKIELLNVSEDTVDLNRWYVTDSGRNVFKFQFTGNDTRLDSGSYLVLNENELGFGFKGQDDDDVWLIAADGDGRPVRFADHLEFGSANEEVSFGRWPNGDGPLVPMKSQTFGQANSAPVNSIDGDLNGDGKQDADDIQFMCQAIHGGDASVDFNVDGRVDLDDLRLFVRSGLNTHIGDANLDGQFDSTDLVAVFQAGEYDDAIAENSTWVDGDWNCDSEFTSRDFVFAFQDGSYVRAVRTSQNDATISPAAWPDAPGFEHSIATHQDHEVAANSVDWSRSRERLVDLVLSNRGHDPMLNSIFAEPPNIEHADAISGMDAFAWIGVDDI